MFDVELDLRGQIGTFWQPRQGLVSKRLMGMNRVKPVTNPCSWRSVTSNDDSGRTTIRALDEIGSSTD